MKLRSPLTSTAFAMLLAGAASQAQAWNYGIYLEGGVGNAEIKTDLSSGEENYDASIQRGGPGFVMDSKLQQSFFSYRLAVGMDNQSFKSDDAEGEYRVIGGNVAQTFSFTVRQRETIRFWAGPELRVGYYEGSLVDQTESDIDFLSAGLGAAWGFNIKLGDENHLAIKAVHLLEGSQGTIKRVGGDSKADIENSAFSHLISAAIMF